ncbi:Protein of unknown function [Aquisalimonas asiatica]|uniref:DUF1826 domain-containing protein n=1 Tax=Aquisalimonas asiatica TaxID=406100 RepID=A0A1H8SXZ0_9GAMM|nr:Protein of unknown function [Aquisalimonas asiatica]
MHKRAVAPQEGHACVTGTACGVLDEVLTSGVNMAIWRRSSVHPLNMEIDTLVDPGWADTIEQTTAVTETGRALTRALNAAGLDAALLAHWIRDMSGLAAVFARVAGASALRIRIEALGDTMCPRFHVDRNTLRLLCTYRGPATEWLSNDQVDRRALASGRPNEEVMRFGPAQRLEPLWVGVMKGSRFPGNEGNGLVHRSPPVEDPGFTRILFCLDACESAREGVTT